MYHCQADGIIDEEELRQFLRNVRHENKLRMDVDVSIPTLMEKYDPYGNPPPDPNPKPSYTQCGRRTPHKGVPTESNGRGHRYTAP